MTNSLATATALATVAFAKVIKKDTLDAAREQLLPGTHLVRAMAMLTGTINVGADGEYLPTVHIPILDAMALLVHDAGITGPNALRAIKEAMIKALEQDDDAKRIIGEARDTLARAETEVRASLNALPKQPRKGQVTTQNLTIEILAA